MYRMLPVPVHFTRATCESTTGCTGVLIHDISNIVLTSVQGPFSAQQLIKVARQLRLAYNTEVLVDSSVMHEGTMWVYLDTLLPLLEDSSNLRNVTHAAEPRSRQRPSAPGQPLKGNRDSGGAGKDVGWGQGDGRKGQGACRGAHRGNDGPGLGDREMDSGARARSGSTGMFHSACIIMYSRKR